MRANKSTALTICMILWTLTICQPGFSADVAATATHTTAIRSLDVVLVMDSSGSMKKTDPDELRKPAAKLFVSLLGEGDRASIVSFSDQGYPVAFLTPVKGDANQKKLFESIDRISNKGISTNLYGAIEAAYQVLEKSPRPDHQRVIILMSDGKMDLGNADETNKLEQQLLMETLPMLKEQGIEVHTIAFTPQSDQTLLKKIAEATGGKFNISLTDKELHAVYTAIFEQNKSPNMLPFEGEKFNIDSAIKEITVVGSKDSAEVVLSLITPGGRMMTAEAKDNNTKWFVSQQFDLITITNPQPGEWKIKASSGQNKAYVITDLKQELVVEPDSPQINEGVLIKTWLEDKGTIINKPSVLQTLAVELHVDTPEGDHHILAMDPEVAEDGTPTNSGIYNSLIALPSDGKYDFTIVANGSTFSREKIKLVNVLAPLPEPVTPVEPVIEPPAATAVEPALESTHVETPPAQSHIEMPAMAPMADTADEGHPVAETEKPVTKKEEHKKPAAEHEKKKDKKATEKKPADEKDAAKEESGGSGIMMAIIIFIIINVVLAGIGGGVYFILKKRKSKANKNEDQDDDAAAQDKPADAKDKAA